MRKSLYIILAGMLAFFTSCEKSPISLHEGQPIYLSVSIPELSQTKTPFEGSVPTSSNPLNVDVWASTTASIFVNEGKDGSNAHGNVVAIHTAGHFQSGEPQLLSQAVYPPPRQSYGNEYTAAPVYFVSMYPQSTNDRKWTTSDGKQAVYTFSGCEDVMFAPQVFGAYDLKEQNQIVTSSPELKFEHLLTRVTVKMGISLQDGETLYDVQEAWGKIKGLSIQSYNKNDYVENLNTVTVNLSKGDEFKYSEDVNFSGQQNGSMNFFQLGTNETFPADEGYLLTQNIDSVAYVICAPVLATSQSHEYVITIDTENRGIQELKWDIEKTADSAQGVGSTRGNHFLITIKFKKGRVIAMEAEVTEWKNGGFGLGNIED